MDRLLAYHWPGNVRELFHSVQRAAVLRGGEVIDVEDLSDAIRAFPAGASGELLTGTEDDLPLRDAVAQVERRLIARALERAGGNRSEAARRLGISRAQLYAKLEEHTLGTRVVKN